MGSAVVRNILNLIFLNWFWLAIVVCEMPQLEERKKFFWKKILFKQPTLPFFVLAPSRPPIFNISTSSDHRVLILASKVAEYQSLCLNFLHYHSLKTFSFTVKQKKRFLRANFAILCHCLYKLMFSTE